MSSTPGKTSAVARDTLIDHLSDGVFVLDAHARLLDANPAALKILGWTRAPLGQPSSQVFSAWKGLLDALRTSVSTEPVKIEVQKTAGGERIFFELAITPLQDKTGAAIGQLLVLHDISAHRQSEEDQENFRRYFNMGSVGMCIISPEKRWVEANGYLCRLLGYTVSELKQLTWSELTFPADLDAELSLFNEVLSNQRDVYQLDKRFVRKDGALVYTSTSVSCYRNPDGGACYFLASMVDISERKQAEEALLKMTAFEERQRLARDLHDSVNQSINGLMLFSETLVATLDRNNMARARQIAGRIQETTRQALKETRLMLYEMQPADVVRGVNFAQDVEIRLLTVERRAGVRAQVMQEGPPECFPQEWHENLFWITIEALNNALKHAQARNVQVIIRCPALEHREVTPSLWDETPQVFELEIIDDGKGFDPDRPRSGGLGLRTMSERAKLLGGDLTIRSKIGEGTSVSFCAEIRTSKEQP